MSKMAIPFALVAAMFAPACDDDNQSQQQNPNPNPATAVSSTDNALDSLAGDLDKGPARPILPLPLEPTPRDESVLSGESIDSSWSGFYGNVSGTMVLPTRSFKELLADSIQRYESFEFHGEKMWLPLIPSHTHIDLELMVKHLRNKRTDLPAMSELEPTVQLAYQAISNQLDQSKGILFIEHSPTKGTSPTAMQQLIAYVLPSIGNKGNIRHYFVESEFSPSGHRNYISCEDFNGLSVPTALLTAGTDNYFALVAYAIHNNLEINGNALVGSDKSQKKSSPMEALDRDLTVALAMKLDKGGIHFAPPSQAPYESLKDPLIYKASRETGIEIVEVYSPGNGQLPENQRERLSQSGIYLSVNMPQLRPSDTGYLLFLPTAK